MECGKKEVGFAGRILSSKNVKCKSIRSKFNGSIPIAIWIEPLNSERTLYFLSSISSESGVRFTCQSITITTFCFFSSTTNITL